MHKGISTREIFFSSPHTPPPFIVVQKAIGTHAFSWHTVYRFLFSNICWEPQVIYYSAQADCWYYCVLWFITSRRFVVHGTPLKRSPTDVTQHESWWIALQRARSTVHAETKTTLRILFVAAGVVKTGINMIDVCLFCPASVERKRE
jgi:hypothetical protein